MELETFHKIDGLAAAEAPGALEPPEAEAVAGAPEAEVLTTVISISLEHACLMEILVIVTAAAVAAGVALADAVAPAERAATAGAVASASSCGIHPLRSSTTRLRLETAVMEETVALEELEGLREQEPPVVEKRMAQVRARKVATAVAVVAVDAAVEAEEVSPMESIGPIVTPQY